MRSECDVYVDTKLAEFEEFLSGTIRSVGRGRQQLRTGSGVPDYGNEPYGDTSYGSADQGRRSRH